MEKKLFSTAMVLGEFCFMLHGSLLFVYTNHKNLIFATLNCLHILCWKLYMEEYGPTIPYHPGKKNKISDTFSQLSHHGVLPIPVEGNAPVVLFNFISTGLDISEYRHQLQSFINLPLPDITENNLVDLKWVHNQQNIGAELAM